MAVPTVLSSSDLGAPFLRGETGSFYTLMKYALPQLGWTLEFDDAVNSRCVFRNSPLGTGDYLRFADNPADHAGADARSVNVRSYSSMSDVDTGTDEVGDSTWLITKSLTADDTARPWIIIGDDKSFFLLISAGGGGTRYNEYMFGDIVSDMPGDSGAFLTQGNNETAPASSSTVTSYIDYGSSASEQSRLRFSLDGLSVGAAVRFPEITHSGALTARQAPPGSAGTYPEPASGGIRVAEIAVLMDQDTNIRGRLRGMLQILNDARGQFANMEVIENQATPRGLADCMVVNREIYLGLNTISGRGVLLFDISTDWDSW